MARAWPNRANYIRFEDADAIRAEIARAVPLYAGIESLNKKGDQVQWGGPTLYADGQFQTRDRKAHFSRVSPRGLRLPPDAVITVGGQLQPQAMQQFRVSTRRGKQFNSMVQREVDPITGGRRDDVFISEEDLARLRWRAGQRARLKSAAGTFDGTLRAEPIKPGNLEVHWPEGNVLLSGSAIDPDSLEPDYNAVVTLEALP
jgi:anaerobic selenocysteine-containing dehydrogenase